MVVADLSVCSKKKCLYHGQDFILFILVYIFYDMAAYLNMKKKCQISFRISKVLFEI